MSCFQLQTLFLNLCYVKINQVVIHLTDFKIATWFTITENDHLCSTFHSLIKNCVSVSRGEAAAETLHIAHFENSVRISEYLMFESLKLLQSVSTCWELSGGCWSHLTSSQSESIIRRSSVEVGTRPNESPSLKREVWVTQIEISEHAADSLLVFLKADSSRASHHAETRINKDCR